MKKTLLTILIAISLLWSAPQTSSGADEAPVVKAIEFRGLGHVRDTAIMGKIAHSLEEPLNYDALSLDIKSLFATGYFNDVRVEAEPFEGGIRLIYILEEKSSLKRIDFRGNKEVDEAKLKDTVTLKPGDFVDSVVLQNNVLKIREVYEKEGYMLVNIVPVVSHSDGNTVFVTFQIDDGPKVKVRTISIKDSGSFQAKEVKSSLKTSEHWSLSFLTGGGKLERKELEEDAERIRDFYFDKGFLKTEVSQPELQYSEDKEWVDISFKIKEGKSYVISSIGVDGNTTYKTEELEPLIKTKAGEPLSRKRIREDLTAISDFYMERGFAAVTVYPEIQPNEITKQATVVFRVIEGSVFRVGRITFTGNQLTRDKVMRRELLLNEGDLFNNKLVRRSFQKIQNLNLFEAINPRFTADIEKSAMNMDVEVKERPTGTLTVGGGYSSTDKIMGMVNLTEGNIGGRAQVVKVSSEFSSKATTYDISFRDPWFLDYPVSFSTGIYNTKRLYSDYSKKATGLTVGLGRRFRDYYSLDLYYNLEDATIYDIQSTASSAIWDQQGTKLTSSITPSFSRDSRDNFMDPHSGTRNSLSLTYAGLGGDNRFYKVGYDSSVYFPVTERTTVMLHGSYGYATGLEGKPLPLYERFYVGGMYTVRGLGYGEAGPKDTNGLSIGGSKKLVFNAEYIFPLVEQAGLKGVVFYDLGTAYDSASKIDMRQGAGAGIRWISPIGPLRLEYGINVDKKGNEQKSRWEFTFGTFF